MTYVLNNSINNCIMYCFQLFTAVLTFIYMEHTALSDSISLPAPAGHFKLIKGSLNNLILASNAT